MMKMYMLISSWDADEKTFDNLKEVFFLSLQRHLSKEIALARSHADGKKKPRIIPFPA